MGFSNALYKISSLGRLVNKLTTTVTISEDIIQITPIIGDTPIPDLIATASEQSKPFLWKPKKSIKPTVKASEDIIDDHTAGLVTPFQITPKT